MIPVLLILLSLSAQAKTVKYELVASRAAVNLSGKKAVDFAVSLNGQIPAPTLEFNEGDEAEITVRNTMTSESLSIHWHGILLPPRMDGVPYLTTPPIEPGESLVFRFKLRQHGTYWYHSHTGVQEQKGVFGAIVIHPKKEQVPADREAVVVLSDWSDENPDQILHNLRKDGDYYLYKKKTMRSIWGAWRAGALGTYFGNEWTRMGGMDLSDVGYDAFLINGHRDSQLVTGKKGDRIRLRVINASGSSYFKVTLGGQSFQVVAADGLDIMPVEAKSVLMGMAETYDLVFKLPENGNYELRASSVDGTGFASTWIGAGQKYSAVSEAPPDMYASMDHSAHGGHAAHGEHGAHHEHGAHSPPKENLGVDDYMALEPTAFSGRKVHDLRFELDGDMRRYTWYINGKAIHQERFVDVEPGQVVRLTFVNKSMMHHPMHLHGHFFRVLNPHGEYSPLKHTVDVPPHSERVIEFATDEPGQWMLHCHNLYHMKTGMGRVISYTSFKPDADIQELQKHDPHLHEHIYWTGRLEGATNHAKGRMSFLRTWDSIDAKIEAREDSDAKWEAEGDLVYRRWFGKYLNVFGGGESFHEEQRAKVGVGYLLPMLIESELSIDHLGKIRLDLDKRLQWTRTVFSDLEITFRQNQKTEYEVSLMYGPSWHWSAGLMLTEEKLGAGAELRF